MRPLLILLIACCVRHDCGAQMEGNGLKIAHLTGGLYVYTTWNVSDSVATPSNSMYLVTNSGVILFDTPWDPMQFQPLLDSIEKKHKLPVVACIVTHYHTDRTAGLAYFKAKGIETYSSELTYEISQRRNFNEAVHHFANDTVFHFDDYVIETYYPGPGHTEDNLVLWFPADKVLYAGCLVKSEDYKMLGPTPDANINEWSTSVHNVIKKFPDAAYVVPGHFAWGTQSLLQHTLRLIKYKRKKQHGN